MIPTVRIVVASWMAVIVGGQAWAGDVLIVLNKFDNTASLLDPNTGVVRATVPVGNGPHEVEVLPGGRTAAVTNYGNR